MCAICRAVRVSNWSPYFRLCWPYIEPAIPVHLPMYISNSKLGMQVSIGHWDDFITWINKYSTQHWCGMAFYLLLCRSQTLTLYICLNIAPNLGHTLFDEYKTTVGLVVSLTGIADSVVRVGIPISLSWYLIRNKHWKYPGISHSILAFCSRGVKCHNRSGFPRS